MKKRTIIACALVAAFVVSAATCLWFEGTWAGAGDRAGVDLLNDGGCEGCNVLLITFETLRADRLKCQGYAADPAPALCAFGETALLFENAYTPAPVTTPTLQAILTGSLPSNEDLLELIAHNDASPTLAATLRKKGYATAAITDHKGLGDLKRQRPKTATIIRDFDEVENFGQGRTGKTSAKAAAAVERWLGDHHKERFFLWTHLFDPHFNWVPADETARPFGFDPGTCGRVVKGFDIEEIHRIQKELSPRELECLEALWLGEVLETDRLVGSILRRLDELGLAGRTIVVVAGDHGEEFMERGNVGHELTVFNELLRVPFMVRNPASKAAGRRANPISTLAIHDYLAAAVDGRNPSALPPVVSRTFHYYGEDQLDPREFRAPPNDFSLVRGSLKIVLTPREGKRALYDLAADPGERRNLWDERAEGTALSAELEAWTRDRRSTADPATTDAVRSYLETVDRLKALGYTR
ncbi:MAG: sulfatase [Proteobacteria bacterium]|nr:sulfatase [Pseudomonadota bacterium]